MKLIAGLGNIGKKYEGTRHNIGFLVLDELVKRLDKNGWLSIGKFFALAINEYPDNIFAKPQTMMNESGKAISAIAKMYQLPPENIYIIHDDLDLRLGTFKIQKGVGPKVHNGLKSIERYIRSSDYYHVRVGIDTRYPDDWIPGEEFVLGKFRPGELAILETVVPSVVDEMVKIV